MSSLVSNTHLPFSSALTVEGSFPRLSHMVTLFRLTLRPVCHRVQSAASLGVQVMVLPLSSSILDCLMAATLHTLPHTGHAAIWSSGNPRDDRSALGVEASPVDNPVPQWCGAYPDLVESIGQEAGSRGRCSERRRACPVETVSLASSWGVLPPQRPISPATS